MVRIFIFFLFVQGLEAQSVTDSIYYELEETMGNTAQYDEAKERRLAGFKALLVQNGKVIKGNERYLINNKLIEEYWSYSFDSTMTYINENTQIARVEGNYEWINKSKLNLALLLASSGRYKESQDILKGINKDYLSPGLLIDFYNCYRKIYSDLDYFALSGEYKEEYAKMYKSYTDSVAPLIEEDEDEYLYLQEWELLRQKRYDDCLMINSARLSKNKPGTKGYSYTTFQRSMIYEQMGNSEMEKKYLALSAISDIKASRKDNASMAKLALRTYEDGAIEKASRYIKYSFEDATFYNSKLRFVEIANSFSLIMASHQFESDKKNRALNIFVFVVSILSLFLFALLFYVQNQKKNLQKAKGELDEINQQYKTVNASLESTMQELKFSYQNLTESNRIKEIYIGNFMNICSEFIDKLDRHRSTVNSMLRAKKYQKLFDMTKSMESINKEVEEFYNTFDNVFLSLYPSFVEDVNRLLLAEEQIELKSGELLNTELRILAVIRLGIKDSSRIAQLLRYSVNTIYNYRAKIKKKAKGDREKFEERVLQIGSYEGTM